MGANFRISYAEELDLYEAVLFKILLVTRKLDKKISNGISIENLDLDKGNR